jgi:hypothetical protein
MQQVTCTHLKEASMPVQPKKENISAMDMCLMIFKENNDFNNAMLEQMKQLVDITIENKQKQSNAISTIGPPIVNENGNNKFMCVCGKNYTSEGWLLRHKQMCKPYAIYASNNNIHNMVCNELDCLRGTIDYVTRKCRKHNGGPRCPNCITWIDSRGGTAKYDGYCATCFKRIFPDDARSKTIYSHTKETMVRNIINNNFKGFIHNTPIYTGNCDCTHRRRIDHRKMFNDTILAIETDEFGHRGYDKHDEEIRYDDLYMIHSGKWIFIRFNPDTNVSKMDIEDKLDVLIETIEGCINRIETGENTELVEIIKLFC